MPKIAPGYVTRYIYGLEKSLDSVKSDIFNTDNQEDAIANHSDIEGEVAGYLTVIERKNRHLNSYAYMGLFGGALAGLAGAVIAAPTMPAETSLLNYLGANAGKSAVLGGGMGVIFDKAMSDDPNTIIRFNEVKELLKTAEKQISYFKKDTSEEPAKLRK
jgi:hypothetical protein